MDLKTARKNVSDVIGRPRAHNDRSASQQRDAGRLVATYDYTDESGKLLFQVLRYQPKRFTQRKPGEDAGNKWVYTVKGIRQVPYRLPALLKAETVFVVEGEKDVHTLEEWEFTATCNACGARKWTRAHSIPLAGKDVVILPDNDDEGREHARIVAESLTGIAKRCRVVDLPNLPPKGDVTDWKTNGGTKEKLIELLADQAESSEEFSDSVPEDSEDIPRFRNNDRGVWFINPDSAKKDKLICPPFNILAMTRQRSGRNYGKLVRFWNREGKQRDCIVNDASLAGDGKEGLLPLIDMGFRPHRDRVSLDRLRDYIYYARPEKTAICVSKLGWENGTTFVLPEQSFGPAGEEILFEGADQLDHKYKASGDLVMWQQLVSRFCRGNSRLMFAVSAAFAPPLLDIIGADTAGFHFCGPSSIGKSTALLAGGSVWGGSSKNGFLETWNGTAGGFEARANLHNDALLCLDEIGEVSDKLASEIIYALGNGRGKMRMNERLQSVGNTQFKLIFLSTGERTLQEILQSAGKQSKGGQEVRMLQIDADAGAGKGMGMFETLHGFAKPGQLADAVIDGAKKAYGAPIIPFLKMLARERDQVASRVQSRRSSFGDKVPKDASGEVGRGAKAFGLVAAAGELATELGITGWKPGDATGAAQVCFQSWIESRGGTGSHDTRICLEKIRTFLLTNPRRFQNMTPARRGGVEPLDPEDEAIIDRAGLKSYHEDGWHHFVLKPVFIDEICRGYDYRTVAKTMIEAGCLERTGANLTDRKRIPGAGNSHVFHVTPKFLDAPDE